MAVAHSARCRYEVAPMKLRVVLVMMLFLSLAGPSLTSGASQPQSPAEPGGSIAGKVTLREKPVSGVLVLVRLE